MGISSKLDSFWRSYGVSLFTKIFSWFWLYFADFGPKSADVINLFVFSWCFLKILMKMSIFAKNYQNRIFPPGNIRVVQICTTPPPRWGIRRPPRIGLTLATTPMLYWPRQWSLSANFLCDERRREGGRVIFFWNAPLYCHSSGNPENKYWGIGLVNRKTPPSPV